MAAIKALQQWCKIQCDGYQDVAISNMTSSFRDGLAFCALIHKFRPDLINFESLSKDDVFYNNHLAFRVAEEHLGIPALLDAEDMVALPVPDRLSILTYVSQYYNYFHGRSPIGGVGGLKRHADYSTQVPSEKKNLHVVTKSYNLKTDMENFPPQTEKLNISKDVPAVIARKSGSEKQVLVAPSQQTVTEKQKFPGLKCLQTSVSPLRERSTHPHCDAEKPVLVESSNKSGTLKSECAVCGSHVHLVQRHLVDGQLYHRSCYKCSVCYGTLKSGAYKVGLDTGRLVCAVHQQAQNAFKPSVKPFRSSGFTPADLVAKSTEIQPSRKYSSVLSIPIKPAPHSVNLSPATHSWTASAQRTQAARKKFFLSCPTAEHQPTMTQQQDHFDFSSSLKMEEQDRTGSAMNKRFPEGNRNNNNALDFNPEMKRVCVSAEVSSQRMKVQSYSSSIVATNQATASSTSIISGKTKETFSFSSTNKERSRPPILDLSSSKAPAENGHGHEASSAWRSKPKAAPKGPGVKHSDLLTNQSYCMTASSSHFNGSFIHASVIEQLNVCGPVSPGLLSETPSSTQPITVKPSCGAQTCVGIDAKPGNSTSASILPLQCYHKPSSKEPFWGSAQSNVNVSSKVELMHQMVSPTIKPCQITQELQEIERRLNDLENEGVELEWRLRVYEEEGHGEHLLDPLMVDWFHLIRKKQSYIRRESELIYIARTQDLEEQQPGVEGELRRLINKPERFKTPDEKKREMQLMQKLMEIVNDRNTIVEELEEDRLREEEEDQQLNEMMLKLGLKKCKRKRQSSFSKLFRRSKKASAGE